MAKMGFMQSIEDMDPFDVNVFCIIDSEIERERQRAIDKEMKKAKKSGRR